MQILDFRKNQKCLRQVSKEISTEDISDPIFYEKLLQMKELLALDGVGLAAPQVGWPVKLFLLCIDEKGDECPTKVFLNPTITSYGKSLHKQEEGCLSFPGLFLNIPRSEEITWSYQDLGGHRHTENARGFYSRAIQHETDHCNGKVFIDHASSAQKLKISKWLSSLLQ